MKALITISILLLMASCFQGCSRKMELIKGNYYKQGDKIVYAENGDHSFSYFFNGHKGELKDADFESFTYLGLDYAKDKNRAYYMSFPILDADAVSFEVISNNFSKDKNSIFAKSEKIEGIDVKTMRRMGEYFNDTRGKQRLSEYYIKDKNQIFYLDEKVEGADYDSFKPSQWNAMDKEAYYYGARRD